MHYFKAIRLHSIQRERRDEQPLPPSGIVVADRYVRRKRPGCASLGSVRAWAEDPLESRSALGVGCAGAQAIIAERKRGDFGDASFRSIRLSPRLHAGSDAYPAVFRGGLYDCYRAFEE